MKTSVATVTILIFMIVIAVIFSWMVMNKIENNIQRAETMVANVTDLLHQMQEADAENSKKFNAIILRLNVIEMRVDSMIEKRK